MGLEGTRLWTSSTEIECTLEVPAEDIPASMTDGRTDPIESTDSYTSGALLECPDPSARPAVGHPLFSSCRELPSDVSRLSLEGFTSDFDGRLEAIRGDIRAGRLEEASRAIDDLNATWRRFNAAHREIPQADRSRLLGRLYLAQASLESARGPHRESYIAVYEARGHELNGDFIPAADLSEEELRDHYASVLRTWTRARIATIDLSSSEDGRRSLPLSDTAITDRMREVSRGLVEVLTPTANTEAIGDFETRLDRAIDDDDTAFLTDLTPETIDGFLTTHEMAQALFAFAREDEGAEDGDRMTAYLESARRFASLGLNGRVSEVLGAAAAYADTIEDEPVFLQTLFQVAGVYQEAGMIEEANSAFLRISFVGENSADEESRNLGGLAHAMSLLNHGHFSEAQDLLSRLPESETTRSLLEGARAGERLDQSFRLLDSFINLYAHTHPYADGSIADDIRTELHNALSAAMRRTGLGENLWDTFEASADEYPLVAAFAFDGPYRDLLRPLTDPSLDAEDYRYRVLDEADGYIDDSEFGYAAAITNALRDDPRISREVIESLSSEIEYRSAREAGTRTGINGFMDGLIRLPGNIISGLAHAVYHTASFFTVGLIGGSFEEDIIGTAEMGVIILSEGAASSAGAAFSESAIAAELSPTVVRGGRIAVETGTFSGVMSPGSLLIRAASERSTEGLTFRELGREFGANLVLFGLCRFTGALTEGAPLPVRWGAGVGSFVGADYANEAIGFRDPSDAPFGARLSHSIAGDFTVRFANWVGNGITGGRFERLREETARREAAYEEAWQAAGRPSGFDYRILLPYLPIPGMGMGGIGFVAGVRRGGAGGTMRMGMVPEIGIRSLGSPETLANIGTNAGRFDQLAGLFETLPEYAALNRVSRSAAETARIREEVSAELGGRFENLTRVSDALQRVLRRRGIDLIASRSGLDARIESGEITGRDASGLSRLASHLLYQFYPDGVPLYRSVHPEYAGLPGTMRESGSDWRVGEAAGPDGEMAYHDEGMVLIHTTMGEIRSAGGRFVIDPHAAVMDALTVVHPGGRAMPYEVVVGASGGTVADAPVLETTGETPADETTDVDTADTIAPGPVTDIFSLLGSEGETAMPPLSPEPSLPPPGSETPVGEERGTVRERPVERATARPPRRGGAVAEPVRVRSRVYGDLPAPFRSIIDRAMIRASAEFRRLETSTGGSLWGRDNVFTRRVDADGTLVISPTTTVARELFLSRLTGEEGVTVDESGHGRYRVTVEGGESYDLRVRLDGAALDSLVDGLVAQGMNQAEIETRLAEEGLTSDEAAAVIGPRLSRAARGGRSGTVSL